MRGNVTETEVYALPKNGRLVVGWISLLTMFLSFAIFILGYYLDLTFVPMLVTVFLFALSASHAWSAFSRTLTQRQVRKIDYWYLGAAAIGMFMFATGYEEQREAAASRTKEYMHRQSEIVFQSAVSKALIPYMLKTCEDDFQQRISDKPCALSEAISEAMQPGTSPDLVDHYLRRLATVRADVINRGANSEFEKMDAVVRESLAAFRKWAEKNPLRSRFVPVDEALRVWSGVSQYFVWPFLLAIALALRITKVTIDVFGWAEG